MTRNDTVVLVTGNFNILHLGHLRLLRFAKSCGDRLVVAVNSDRKSNGAAHVAQELRLEGIKCAPWVDEAFISDEPDVELVRALKPGVVVKGKEHEQRFNPEEEALKEYGGKLLFSSGEESFSSNDLIRKEFFETAPRTINLPQEYLVRHQTTPARLAALLREFSRLKVCVIGDLIVDEYITCHPLGMSQEEPTIVVTPVDSKRFVGGAGIVAAHAVGLGAEVRYISVAGQDATRDFAMQRLTETGVSATLLVDDSRPTTLKQRFRSKGKSLLRVSHLHQRPISLSLQKRFLAELKQALAGADVLVFSDFSYGCLPQSLVEQAIDMARGDAMILAADSQSSSQVGDISRFHDMDLLTPTEREARISMRNHEDGLVVLAEKLQQKTGARNIILTLGEEGLLVQAGQPQQGDWQTDRIDALNSAPKDVAGAGDSLLITSAMALACGGSLWEAACLGSLAAAIQVGRVGNTPLLTDDLMREMA
ncbi:PfkB family carbohydrate kinase [Pseudodesulfovibrio sp.]|uniref:PfkB family carbohydrate kinase n=1 Tax=Pseudodesulfovibrio sp. TaxID=2035812 RepID=UPI002601CE98|nr:PfkB family carbohydrate kinase [Pseudodesulfovibrio sp.]MDD3312115.1 PfkB family carbohydrate kinase [Pseudodesulfovibrio sp.]